MKDKFFSNEGLVINGINFTSRKVDILACICKGYTIKTTATLLNISVNTINTHLKQIFLLTNSYARDQLIKFCEKSDEYQTILDRYDEIILFNEFINLLYKIRTMKLQEKYIFHVMDDVNIDQSIILESIKLCDLEYSINDHDFFQNNHINIICSKKDLSKDYRNYHHLFIIDDELVPCNYSLLKDKNKYLVCSNVLRNILPKSTDKIIDDFQNKFIHNDIVGDVINVRTNKSRTNIIYILSIVFCFMGFLSYILYTNHSNKLLYTNVSIMSLDKMIFRDSILSKIDQSIKLQDGIKYIILNAIGGSGKTTLARQYINRNSFDLSWEINAETPQSLLESLYELAEEISDYRNKQNELLLLKSIPDIEERNKRIFEFIISEINEKNVCLLFDNVDDIDVIKQYLPQQNNDNFVILITTRNEHIKNYNKFNTVSYINVEELSNDEQFELFVKILYEDRNITKCEIEKIKNFLVNIPKLPLDVSASAYYIKHTESSFDDYLKSISYYHREFEKVQKKISVENTEYSDTRLGILISNFDMLIRINESFKDLLLLVCVFDSQNILIEYLKQYKESYVVDDFVYHLKKYSLVDTKDQAIFIHRSTQDIGFNYLLSKYQNLDDDLSKIVNILTNNKINRWNYNIDSKNSYRYRMIQLSHIESVIKKLSKFESYEDIEKYKTRLMEVKIYLYKNIKPTLFIKDLSDTVLERNAELRVLSSIEEANLLLYTVDICFYGAIGHESKKYAERCIDVCGSNKELAHLKAICLSYLARYYFFYDEKAKGKMLLEQALEALNMIEDKNLWKIALANVYIQYGICYSGYYLDKEEILKTISMMEDALKYLKADQFFYKSKAMNKDLDIGIVSELRFNMFKMYNTINEYSKAIECAEEISFLYELEEEKGNNIKLNRSIFDMQKGRTFLRLGRAEEAYDCLDKSITTCLEIDSTNLNLLLGYVYKSEAAIRIKKYEEGYEASMLALNCKEKDHNFNNLVDAVCYYNMSIAKYKMNQVSKSIEFFKLFLKIAEDFCKMNLTKEKFEILQKNGDFTFINDINECLTRSNNIFTLIYSTDHPFVRDYTHKNTN